MNIYTKNFYVKQFGNIGGKEVTADIDRALNAALSAVHQKASDYHSEKPKKKAKTKTPE